ncbi:diaphanous related formin 1 [Phyllostomus discolor]|uniref:Diaphanous related formin 1 n=1 Tax=Phyllostomus discolor TaxID=89673 RepID=A0A833YXD9_9CHIR|nr:diaphanous related formin 1 [Phyllostomus discolor]
MHWSGSLSPFPHPCSETGTRRCMEEGDETGVMDSLLEALQSGAAFRRKRGPRQDSPLCPWEEEEEDTRKLVTGGHAMRSLLPRWSPLPCEHSGSAEKLTAPVMTWAL